MMPYRQIAFVPNSYYHIFNRGSEKRTIFQSHRDYSNFLTRVKENAQKYAIEVNCYCLLPNHFHFLLTQTAELSITSFMNSLQLGYAKFFNTKYERVGPLFQGRFKAKLVESESYLLQLSAYIHRNPIAHLSDFKKHASEMLRTYPHSSYREYLALEPSPICKPEMILSYFSKTNPNLSYEAFVTQKKINIEAMALYLYDVV